MHVFIHACIHKMHYLSPCTKNSSMHLSAHCLARGSGLAGLDMSHACSAKQIRVSIDPPQCCASVFLTTALCMYVCIYVSYVCMYVRMMYFVYMCVYEIVRVSIDPPQCCASVFLTTALCMYACNSVDISVHIVCVHVCMNL
jgi:hypothetical protein